MNTKIGMVGRLDFHLRRLKPTDPGYSSKQHITSGNCNFASIQWNSLKIGLRWNANRALFNQHNFWSRNTIGTWFIFNMKTSKFKKIQLFEENQGSEIAFKKLRKQFVSFFSCFRQVKLKFQLCAVCKIIGNLLVSLIRELFQYGRPSIPILVFMDYVSDFDDKK